MQSHRSLVPGHAAEYGIDADLILVIGTSAGGHLAALLGTSGDADTVDVGENLEHSSKVQAVVDYYGPTDFRVAVGTPGHEGKLSAISQLLGGPVEEHLQLAARANPIAYASEDDPPFLILHGEADPLVPLNQSELLCKALRQAKVPVEFHVIQGGGHGGEAFQNDELKQTLDEFLKSHR